VRLQPLNIEPMNLSKKAADVLRQAIITAEMPAGTRLIEEDIAEQLGVSRMPVRQAIQQLTDEGLVEKIPGKGAFVQQYSPKDLDELYSLRIVLEQFAVELLVKSDAIHDLEQLHKIVDCMAEAAQEGDKLALFELDAEFHHMLVILSGHNLLQEALSGIRLRISNRILQGIVARSSEELILHYEKHRRLLAIIESGDLKSSLDELKAHVLEGKDRISADPKQVS
jgi:DNA-binding GntR family transcriptional regulator